jgi:hypothetical protein
MRNLQFKLGTIVLLASSYAGIYAQESINTTGGNASGSGGSASFSVGEVVYTTILGTNGSVAEGVQQPYEISVVTGIEETAISLSINAYPNPTAGFLQLQVEGELLKDLSYQLFDMQGKLLKSDKITGKLTQMNLNGLVPATYFVIVAQGNKEIKQFKVIKN